MLTLLMCPFKKESVKKGAADEQADLVNIKCHAQSHLHLLRAEQNRPVSNFIFQTRRLLKDPS